MYDPECTHGDSVNGKLEGIIVSLLSDLGKTFSTGAYGVVVRACRLCGCLYDWRLTQEGQLQLIDLTRKRHARERVNGSEAPMTCKSCGKDNTALCTLEGAYFVPEKKARKGFFSRKIHHPVSVVCLDCGSVQRISIPPEELRGSEAGK